MKLIAAQSCLTPCDPMDYSPPVSSVHGISQARILEWVAISFSRGSPWPRDWTHVSCIGRQILYHKAQLCSQLCLTLCAPMHSSPPGSSVHGDTPGKNTGVGCMPSSSEYSKPRIKCKSPTLQVVSLPSEPWGKSTEPPGKAIIPISRT